MSPGGDSNDYPGIPEYMITESIKPGGMEKMSRVIIPAISTGIRRSFLRFATKAHVQKRKAGRIL
jgi:hypothetical protein